MIEDFVFKVSLHIFLLSFFLSFPHFWRESTENDSVMMCNVYLMSNWELPRVELIRRCIISWPTFCTSKQNIFVLFCHSFKSLTPKKCMKVVCFVFKKEYTKCSLATLCYERCIIISFVFAFVHQTFFGWTNFPLGAKKHYLSCFAN